MTNLQRFLAFLLILGICAILCIPLLALLLLGDPVLVSLWIVFMALAIALVLKHAIRFMAFGKAVILSCFGNRYALYSSAPGYKNGTGNSGILATVPFMVQRYIMPEGAFLISVESNTAYTKDDGEKDPTAAVRVFAHIQVQLELDLSKLSSLLALLPGADRVYDFTKPVWETMYTGQTTSTEIEEESDSKSQPKKDFDSPLPNVKLEKCVRLARYLRTLLQTPFDEAVGQAIPGYTLREALENTAEIQDKIMSRLGTDKTVFKTQKVEEMFSVFDINLISITPADQKVLDAVDAHAIALRQGKAKIATATADAKSITLVAQATQQPGGVAALASRTMEKVGSVTLVTGTSLLEAGAAALVKPEEKPVPVKTDKPS